MSTGTLAHVRVLDLGRYVSAPHCAMLLGDLGAEVIRVERLGGDDDRRIGWTADNGENVVFPSLARGKLGVTIDFRHPRGRTLLEDLIRHCDVFVHNFSPGAARAMRLDYDAIRAVRSDVIYTAVSSWGSEGPYADRPGFDPIAQMASGAAGVTGYADEPLRAGVPWVDYLTGVFAAFGTMAALHHRDRTGEGQAVACSLLQSALTVTAPVIAEAILSGSDRPRLGNRAAHLGPCDLYACLDGHIYVAAATNPMWRALMRTIGRAEVADDPAYATDLDRFAHRLVLDPLVAEWTARHTTEQALDLLIAARVPCGMYRRPSEVVDDPQVRAQHMLAFVDQAIRGLSPVPIAPHPIRYSTTSARPLARAPRVGEHNDRVFAELLGYSAAALAELSAEGII